jgi:hypothetical protein
MSLGATVRVGVLAPSCGRSHPMRFPIVRWCCAGLRRPTSGDSPSHGGGARARRSETSPLASFVLPLPFSGRRRLHKPHGEFGDERSQR